MVQNSPSFGKGGSVGNGPCPARAVSGTFKRSENVSYKSKACPSYLEHKWSGKYALLRSGPNSPSLERGEVLEMDLVPLGLYRACLEEFQSVKEPQ